MGDQSRLNERLTNAQRLFDWVVGPVRAGARAREAEGVPGVDLDVFEDRVRPLCEMVVMRKPEAPATILSLLDTYRFSAIGYMREAEQRKARGVEDAFHRARAQLHILMSEQLQALARGPAATINPLRPEQGGTAATERGVHSRRDPILGLWMDGRITYEQVMAARLIAWVFESVARGTMVGSPSYTSGGAGRAPKGSGRPVGDISYAAAIEHANIYKPWAQQFSQATPKRPACLPALINVIVYGQSVYAGARQARMSWGRFFDILDGALADYDARSHGRR